MRKEEYENLLKILNIVYIGDNEKEYYYSLDNIYNKDLLIDIIERYFEIDIIRYNIEFKNKDRKLYFIVKEYKDIV